VFLLVFQFQPLQNYPKRIPKALHFLGDACHFLEIDEKRHPGGTGMPSCAGMKR
jgi:hypothetical protein